MTSPSLSSLWDMSSACIRLSTSGRQREAISIDLHGPSRTSPCRASKPTPSQEGYRAFLLLIPGDLSAQLSTAAFGCTIA